MNNDMVEMESPLVLDSGDNLLAMAANAEKRIVAVKKIKELALRVTNQNDWQDEGGKPYLWVSGAEKVARLFNLSWRIDDVEVEDHEDGHFTFTYKGHFGAGGKEIEAIGTRSSRDPFYSKTRSGDVPPERISRGNVKKAAMTNCIGNGVTRFLGIRNLTWEELAAAGITKGQSGSVNRTGVPTAPKWGEFAGQPLTEINDEWLNRYGEFAANALEIGEKEGMFPTDSAEEKKRKQVVNAGIDKKIKFKSQNEKLFQAILEEVDRRKAEAGATA